MADETQLIAPAVLLSEVEHHTVDLLSEVWECLEAIIGDGPTAPGDRAHAQDHVLALQRMILAQAAARAYPASYRLLGAAEL